MRCTGTVIDSTGDVARVLIESSACGDCHECGFSSASENKRIEVNALNKVNADKDDPVLLEVSGRKIMEASALLFLVPFGGFIIGFLVGYYPVWYLVGTARTLVAVAFAFACLVASYYPVHLLGERSEFEFVIKGIATADEPPSDQVSQPPQDSS